MKKYWWESALFTFMFNSSSMLFAFLTFLVLVRVLSQEEFGIWALYLTVVTMAEMVRNGITQNALLKFIIGKEENEYRSIATAALFINVLTGLICYLIIIALASFLSKLWQAEILNKLLYLYGIHLVLSLPMIFFQFMGMANMNFKARFFSNFAYQAVNFLLVLLVFMFKGQVHLYQLPLIQAGAAVFGLVVIIFKAKQYLKFTTKINWQWVSKLFHFGKFVFATNISSMLFKRMDTIMLGYFLNPIAVAIYSVPDRVGNYVEVPMNSMANIVFPQAAKRIEEQGIDAVRYLYERSVGALLAIVIPLAVIVVLFAEKIILLVAGEAYLEAVPILQFMAVVSVLKPFGRQGGTILDSAGYPNHNFYSLLLALIINVILNWFFISRYGVMGAVIATMFAMVFGTLIQQIVLVKKLKINPHHPFIYMWVTYRDAFKKGKQFLERRGKNVERKE